MKTSLTITCDYIFFLVSLEKANDNESILRYVAQFNFEVFDGFLKYRDSLFFA